MAMENLNLETADTGDRPLQPELLVAAALHLMSHYSTRDDREEPCLKLAAVIERHLRALAGHDDLTPVLRATCLQLSGRWAGIVEQTTAHQPKRGLFNRFYAPRSGV